MGQAFSKPGWAPSALPRGITRGITARRLAWAGLALAAGVSLFPLRFTATATLAFDVGTQPPAGVVRGVAQVLASREITRDVVARLDPADVARLASGASAGLADREDFAAAPARMLAARAARRLEASLDITSADGGRALEVSASAPGAALAARVANAYVAALLELDAAVRAAHDRAEPLSLPTVRRGAPTALPVLPDPPRPLALALLGLAGLGLAIAASRRRPQAEDGHVPVDARELPVELKSTRRIFWLDAGTGVGLDLDDAVARLAHDLPTHAPPAGAAPTHGPDAASGRLVVLSSDDLPDRSATCAVHLARALAEERRVALVALDGTAQELGALVSDPWAPGVSELLFGVAGFRETIHRDAHSRAHVIPPGRDGRGDAGLVGAERLTLVLHALRQTYDYVIVAAPSLMDARGAERLAGLDPVLVCVHADTTPATTAVESYEILAGEHFPTVMMLCLATGLAVGKEEEAPVLPPGAAPSLDAVEEPPPDRQRLRGGPGRKAPPPRLAGAA